MHVQEARSLSDADLAAAVDNAHQELFNLRFQQATGRLGDSSRLAQVRRDIARLKTVQRERELWAAYETTASTETE